MTTTARARRARFRLFCSYAHEDRVLLEEVRKHLSVLERSGLIAGWDDRAITAGSDWEGRILDALERADVILLLISADFLASDYCWDVEMRRALVREAAREALVVPIILRPCDWAGAPFARLQCLPQDGRAIVSWSPRDAGYLDVAEGLRRALLLPEAGRGTEDAPDAVVAPGRGDPAERAEARVMDGAIANAVPVGRATDVVAMVRTPGSGGLRAVLEADAGFSAGPGDVEVSDFTMDFPVDESGRPGKVEVVLRLESGDFEPPAQEKTIEVRPGEDSRTCVFLATAVREGPLLLNLELRHRGVSVVQQLLRTAGRADVERRTLPSYVVHSTGEVPVPPRQPAPAATGEGPHRPPGSASGGDAAMLGTTDPTIAGGPGDYTRAFRRARPPSAGPPGGEETVPPQEPRAAPAPPFAEPAARAGRPPPPSSKRASAASKVPLVLALVVTVGVIVAVIVLFALRGGGGGG